METKQSKRKYIVAFTRNSNVGREEYDAGTTIEDARKEVAFFRANLPPDVAIEVYYYQGGCGWSHRCYVKTGNAAG